MFHNGYKNDVKLSWDKATKTVKVRWTDYEKVLHGAKGYSRYGGMQRKCGVRYTRKQLEEELLAIANREQQKSIERAEAYKKNGTTAISSNVTDISKAVVASSFLRLMEDKRITKSERPQTINDCRKDVNRFADWLDKHHRNIELHKITKLIAQDYCRYLGEQHTYSSVRTYKAHLVKVFNNIVDIFEESPIKYTNPFARFALNDVLTDTVINRKSIFTIEQLAYILKRAGEHYKYRKAARIQRFAFFYLLIVTGWRVGDLAEFTWDCVDFNNRRVTNLHNKTAKSTGVYSKIYMTDLMQEILITLRDFERPKKYKKYLFSVGRDDVKDLRQRNVTNSQTHMDNIREELGLHEARKRGKNLMHTHTIHSIRGSFITHMSPPRYDEKLVNYIVGHQLVDVNDTNYKRYDSDPEFYTREIIETMEGLVDARHAFNVALYGEKQACGLMTEGDSIDDMPDGWEEYLLKNRFWTEEGLAYLRFKSVQGNPPHVIKGMIAGLNKFRVKQGARWVDAALVEKYTGLPYDGLPDMNDPKVLAAMARARARQQSGDTE